MFLFFFSSISVFLLLLFFSFHFVPFLVKRRLSLRCVGATALSGSLAGVGGTALSDGIGHVYPSFWFALLSPTSMVALRGCCNHDAAVMGVGPSLLLQICWSLVVAIAVVLLLCCCVVIVCCFCCSASQLLNLASFVAVHPTKSSLPNSKI